MRELDCDFCSRLDGDPADRPWYDFNVLDSDEHFVVVAALGALTPGHIMIVSNDHFENMAELAVEHLEKLHDVVMTWAGLLRRRWGPVFIFENGGRSTRGGACIFHAHLQLLPMPKSPTPAASAHNISRLKDLPAITSGRPYVLLWSHVGISVQLELLPRSGQMMRRSIASAFDRAHEWDYLVFPNLDNVRLTIDALAMGSLSQRSVSQQC